MIFNNEIKLDVRKFIKIWNSKYPFDRWWRKKYNIPFGSKQHRDACFIDMVVEYKEDIYFKKLMENDEDNDFEKEVDEIINSTDKSSKLGKKIVKMTKKELDDEFDNLDIENFNE